MKGDDWYVSAGQGLGACLNMASKQRAYVLTDRGAYFAHEFRHTMEVLLEESGEMMNTYS